MERIYHTWDKWECYPAGFYENRPKDKSLDDDACRDAYAAFLRDSPMFEAAMMSIILKWKNSCEHYLTNEKMNRIAWMGQASLCYARGIPSIFCGGFNRLSQEEQAEANRLALKYINVWMDRNNHPALTMEQAESKTKANLY